MNDSGQSNTYETPLYQALKKVQLLEEALAHCEGQLLELETKTRADKEMYIATMRQVESKMNERNNEIIKLVEHSKSLESRLNRVIDVAGQLIGEASERWNKYLEKLSD